MSAEAPIVNTEAHQKSQQEIAAQISRIGNKLVERATSLPEEYMDLSTPTTTDQLYVRSSSAYRLPNAKLSHYDTVSETNATSLDREYDPQVVTDDGKRKLGSEFTTYNNSDKVIKRKPDAFLEVHSSPDTVISPAEIRGAIGGPAIPEEGRGDLNIDQSVHAAAGTLSKLRGEIAKRENMKKSDEVASEAAQKAEEARLEAEKKAQQKALADKHINDLLRA